MILDCDQNGIHDDDEMSLASKFCPILKMRSGDHGVRPVPVEIFDRNNDGILNENDILVDIYNINGVLVAVKPTSEIVLYGYPVGVLMSEAYSFINSKSIYKRYCWTTDGTVAGGMHILVPHFEFGDIGHTSGNSWYSTWDQKMSEHPESAYQYGTTYAHLFKHGTNTVIQYWFFYPFNHAANRHEGDWEHINVIINSQDPTDAEIVEVEYWGHYTQCIERSANDAELTQGTHTIVYVAGRTSIVNIAGNGSHANYPESGSFPVGGGINELVDGNGIRINFGNFNNIVLIANIDYINEDSDYKWMHFPSFWGNIQSYPSIGSQIIPFTSLWDDFMDFLNVNTEDDIRSWSYKLRNSNIAPFSPYWQTKWEIVH